VDQKIMKVMNCLGGFLEIILTIESNFAIIPV
jgi:hypothetical protein